MLGDIIRVLGDDSIGGICGPRIVRVVSERGIIPGGLVLRPISVKGARP